MYQTQTALITHLKSARLNAKTIKRYAGEVQSGMRGRIDLPAMLVLFEAGNPVAPVPQYTYDLLYCTVSDYHQREAEQKDALIFAQGYNRWLMENDSFGDSDRYYRLINLKSSPLKTILADHKYTILSQKLTVRAQ